VSREEGVTGRKVALIKLERKLSAMHRQAQQADAAKVRCPLPAIADLTFEATALSGRLMFNTLDGAVHVASRSEHAACMCTAVGLDKSRKLSACSLQCRKTQQYMSFQLRSCCPPSCKRQFAARHPARWHSWLQWRACTSTQWLAMAATS
jgi:hypothetical protein